MNNYGGINFERINALLFYCAIFILVFAFGVKTNIIDFDLWARLINGQHVFLAHQPLFEDNFSFAKTHTWFDPEWITSAFLYLIQKCFGIAGLTFVKCFSFFLLICTIIFTNQKLDVKNNQYNIIYYGYIILIAHQTGFLSYSTRCQIFSFIFLVLWLFLLEKIRQGNDKLLFLLPIIMIFWLNTHGACIAGVGIIFLYALGEFLNKKPFKKYFLILIPVALAFALNPWGVDYYRFIFDSAFVDRQWISEWKPLFEFIPLYCNLFFYGCIIAIFSYIFQIFYKKENFKILDKTKLILILVLLYLSNVVLKHIGLAIVVFSIFLYDDICDTFKILVSKVNKKNKSIFINIFYLVLFLYSILLMIAYPMATSWQESFLQKYPVLPLEFLKENNYKGKLLTNFQSGSFIAYKYGNLFKIYMDGRQEQVYYPDCIKNLMDFYNYSQEKKTQIEAFLVKYRPDIVLLESNLLVNDCMLINSNYFLLYDDKIYSVYVLNKYKTKKHHKNNFNKKLYFEKLFDTHINFSKDI